MRIMLLSTSMGMGGADQQILILARAMRARNHQVRIIALAPLGQMGFEARDEGIPTESLGLQRSITDVPRIFRLVKMLREWRPDVLHSHMLHANLLARAVRPLAQVPVLLSTIHSINDGGALPRAAYRFSSRMVDRVTIISRLAAERYVASGAVPADLLEVVPNAVDTERFRRLPHARSALRQELGLADEFVWIAVGRFEEAKDYPNMIGAFTRVAAERPMSRLLLVGKGSLKDNVEQLVRSGGLEGRVHFLGVRRDVPELMSAADGYLLSSAWEGMPVVLLEAASVELPIVATRVGGVAEVVEDGTTGFLVAPGEPDALAGAMLRLQRLEPEARVAMGAQARAFVQQHYSTARIMDRWDGLYARLGPGSTPSPRDTGRLGDTAV
jgi:glycosyltransferase involved in cell wall biosynthesis